MICDECDGRGWYLDAPSDVLDGRSYQQRCHVCDGTGHKPDLAQTEVSAVDTSATLRDAEN